MAEVSVKYRWRVVLQDMLTGKEQGVLIPPGTKQVTVAVPDNEGEAEQKDLYLVVKKSGVAQLPGPEERKLPGMQCPVCGREM